MTTSVPVTARYLVSGMTCAHCVAAVSAEVGAVAGVRAVEVDLATGRMVVTSVAAVPLAALAAAVDEAGYTLATAS